MRTYDPRVERRVPLPLPPDNDPEDLADYYCTALSDCADDECEDEPVLTWSMNTPGDAWGHALCEKHAHEVYGEELPKPQVTPRNSN